MGRLIIYKGPTDKSDISDEFHVRDENDKMHRLRKGEPEEVPDSLADELLAGSDRLKGHKFEEAKDEDATSTPRPTSSGGSGPGGSGPALGSPSGTTPTP